MSFLPAEDRKSVAATDFSILVLVVGGRPTQAPPDLVDGSRPTGKAAALDDSPHSAVQLTSPRGVTDSGKLEALHPGEETS